VSRAFSYTDRRMGCRLRLGAVFFFFICNCLAWAPAAVCMAGSDPSAFDFSSLATMLGARDAVMVAAPDGRVLLAHNPDLELIPASTLKLLTSLAALHYLTPDFRFTTAFYLGKDDGLKIEGRGDPLLISEVVREIAALLAKELAASGARPRRLVLDNTFFRTPVIIPGVSGSSEPYDAPNGALCVNFNTINFKKERGAFVSAEPQTPLLPSVLPRVKASGLRQGRITLSHNQDEITRYAGHLFNYFFKAEGLPIAGGTTIGKVTSPDRLLLSYRSRFSLEQLVAKMLAYSNNFMANQVFLYLGAAEYGAPGTLEKGAMAVVAYARNELGLERFTVREGSGISRLNRLTAGEMMTVLKAFEPYHGLMRNEGRHFFKTGHLRGIRTQVGYYEIPARGRYRYVVFLNTPGKSMLPIERRLLKILESNP